MSAPGALASWGRYPRPPLSDHVAHWRDELPALLSSLHTQHGHTLAWGNGRSYGDVGMALSGEALVTRRLDRLLAADWDRGVVAAEAGITLRELIALCLPRGWFPSVVPGTQHVTLGGAIANDVHGKNHHRRGSFGAHVQRLGLLRSDRGQLNCSADENPELFRATLGGLGLSGVIEWAQIALMRVGASAVDAVTERFGDLDEFFALSRELDPQHEFSVSWIDCAHDRGAADRGIYSAGNFASAGALEVEARPARALPFTPPLSLVNRLSVRAFNSLYWHASPTGRRARRIGYRPFFFPLDGIERWNRLYGPQGFQQHQCLIPETSADALQTLLREIRASQGGSFLAVIKRFGDAPPPGLLSFPAPGITLAVDFPQDTQPQAALFPRLDAIVREAGGRLYPAKDAHMSAADFRRAYPAWTQAEALRDPALMSRFWQRVTTEDVA